MFDLCEGYLPKEVLTRQSRHSGVFLMGLLCLKDSSALILCAHLAHLREDSTRLCLTVQMAALESSGPPFPSPSVWLSGADGICTGICTGRASWSPRFLPAPWCHPTPGLTSTSVRVQQVQAPLRASLLPCTPLAGLGPALQETLPRPHCPTHSVLPLTLSTRVEGQGLCAYLYLVGP